MAATTVGQAGENLRAAQRATQVARAEFAKAGERAADEAAQVRAKEIEAKRKQPTFRMSPAMAARKLVYEAGLPHATEPWWMEIFARLQAAEERLETLENSSATPAHLRAVEKRG